ncbi:MAG: thioredoxin [Microthrixaceae bacterium]|nr:thioredoxin [Microthrixaceae bacterium]MCO5311502.1 thioredoxin [Microthrixaceae bacterium]
MAEGLAQLTEATFAEEIGSSEVPVLVDFWATWCKPCLMVAPILEEIADEQADQLKIVKVDVDANPTLARQFDVMSIPTMILFKDGQPELKLVGAKGKAQLVQELSAHL